MHARTFLALWAIVAFVLFRAIAFIADRQRRAKKFRELGCKPAPLANPRDPLGISALRQLIEADNAHRVPDLIVERTEKVSEREGRLVTTMRNVVLGEETIFTCEPRNIQAILAALPGHTSNDALPADCDERVFAYAFDKAQWYLSRAGRLGKRYWLGHTPGFKKQCDAVHAFVDHFVQMALQQPTDADADDKQHPQEERYVFLRALASHTSDPAELRSQLLNILLAGRDTTASLLSWLLLLLARHPHTYTTLRAAVLAAFGPSPATITYAGLKACAPLQHALAETLRLCPVVPLNSRRAAEVEYSVHAMQRRADLWGPDADAFRPERWEGRKGVAGWEYLPFNGGPRICIGQQFALTEAGYVVARLLQRFDRAEACGGDGPLKHGLTLTDCPAEGVRVRLREARE